MANLMEGWEGEMDIESVAATVYTFVFNDFLMSLFHAYLPDSQSDRLSLLEAYP